MAAVLELFRPRAKEAREILRADSFEEGQEALHKIAFRLVNDHHRQGRPWISVQLTRGAVIVDQAPSRVPHKVTIYRVRRVEDSREGVIVEVGEAESIDFAPV